MPTNEALERENAALRERLTRLSEASLRINAELELHTLLREVLEAARALTGARFSGITTLDATGKLQDFIIPESGEAEYQALIAMPEGMAFFDYLHRLEGPLRVDDLRAHVESLGLGPFPLRLGSYLAVPMHHRGERVGGVHLAEKQGAGVFSAADEETLSLFAAQAAIAIVNARRMREERRARANLETLVETSPVGVVLLDAPTGTVLSFNRETRRLVDQLRDPEQSPEQVLRALTYRRADGSEISFAELPLARALGAGESLRAEEVEIQAADGRRVTALVNATPIRSAEGRIESVVVTLQDLAPLENLQRLRTDFLAMVSHELRTPLSSIRGSAAALLKSGMALDPAAATQFQQIIEQQAEHMEELITDLLDAARIESGELAVAPEAVAVEALVMAAHSSFRSGAAAHDIEIDLPAHLARVMADRRRIVQVLLNLLVNAARHSPGAAAIRLSAVQRDVEVQITVADDGIGIEPERLDALFRVGAPERLGGGLLKAESGLGLTISKGIVEAHGGRIWAESEGPGEGAQFHFTLPAVEQAALPLEPGAVRPVRGQFRILVVDDDPQTLRYVREALEEADCDPVLTGDPEAVRPLIAQHRPHLVLLDLILPETNGMELMERLPELQELPVIFISAYGGDERIARALELGADDYIVKPFSPTELLARVKTVLRRAGRGHAGRPEPGGRAQWGELAIQYPDGPIELAGKELELTYLEQRLLLELSLHAGRVMSHAEILPRVWGPAHSGRTGAVRTLVKQLRQKLGDDAEQPTWIFNEPRVGYRMPKPDEPGEPDGDRGG